MNSKLISILILLIISNSVKAFDLDLTVDDDIRKNYNSTKLVEDTKTQQEESLPELPVILDMKEDDIQTPNPQSTVQTQQIKTQSTTISNRNIKISKGTSFNVINSTKVNDWQGRGTKIKFYTKQAIVKRKYTIPANTIFTGEIIETHQPQITCNGGLVVIRIRSMQYKGQTIPINAYITKADSKMIFLNNIKGDRTYLKTMWQKGNWGRTLFGKMLNLTVNLGGDGATLLLSPFPFAYGTICLGLNTLTSPICAFFSKGGHVSIPAGSEFRIRLLDDAFIN